MMQMKQMNFLMTPHLICLNTIWKMMSIHEWKHYYTDSDETNDTIPYDPKNENWHDNLSNLEGSKIAFNQQSLNTSINNLTNALAKNLSQPVHPYWSCHNHHKNHHCSNAKDRLVIQRRMMTKIVV